MAQPMNYESMRMNARFLTDRMAYTLNIRDPYVINTLYQINYDYIWGVNDYLDDVALGYRYDDFMAVCYSRDTALERLLGRALWLTLTGYDYFYRPISFINNRWAFGIYAHDSRYNHFYYAVPTHFHTYHGGVHFHGMVAVHGGNRFGARHDWAHCTTYYHDRHGVEPPHRQGNRPGGYSGNRNDRPAYNGNGNRNDRPAYNGNGNRNDRPAYNGNGNRNDRPAYNGNGNRNDRPAYNGNSNRNDRPSNGNAVHANRNDGSRDNTYRPQHGTTYNSRPNNTVRPQGGERGRGGATSAPATRTGNGSAPSRGAGFSGGGGSRGGHEGRNR